jgi:hypothetical protein
MKKKKNYLLILFSILYLRMCTLQLQALQCVEAPDPLNSLASDAEETFSLYLSEDLQTKCFQGEHLRTVIIVLVLMLVYTLGFPLFCLLLLSRAFASEYSTGAIGLLWHHVKWMRGDVEEELQKFNQQAREGMMQQKEGGQNGKDKKAVSFPSASSDYYTATAALNRYREDSFGYLFLNYKPSMVLHCVFDLYLIQFCIALVQVFALLPAAAGPPVPGEREAGRVDRTEE